jgi:hypothetical protein
MSKRSLLGTLVLGALLLVAGYRTSATAAAPVGWNPSSDAGFEGLPDRDPNSARFLIVSGPGNSTLPGDVSGPGETFLALTFDPAVTGGSVRIALFDPNSIGVWDQQVDRRLLTIAPNVRYRLYSDANGDAMARLLDGDNTNDPATVRETDAYSDYNADPTSDANWCSYYDAAAAATPGAQTALGTYRFLLRVTLEPAPGQIFLQGPERCGHKVGFNGTYLLPANAVFGFAGGAVDERTIVGLDNQLIHQSFDPATTLTGAGGGYHYNGVLQFNLLGTQACFGDIVMQEADADYQAPSAQGGTLNNPLQNPTGVPPDNVAFYRVPGDAFPYRDLSAFLILDPATPGGAPRPIRWSIFPQANLHDLAIPGTVPTPANPPFSSAASTVTGNPSLDVNQQPGVFQSATLSQATLLAQPGPWCIRWESVDKANFLFMRFNRDVGTTPPAPRLEGRVFCDSDADGVFDQGLDTSLGLPISLSLQRVNCAGGAPIGAPIPVVTALDGTWSVDAVLPGCYDVSVVTPIAFAPTGGVVLPLRVEVAEDECLSNIDIGYDCTQPICGLVFCDANVNCIYDEGDTAYPSTVTVVVQRIDDQGQSIGQPVLVPVTNLEWCAEDLPIGRYRVSLTPAGLPVVPGCPSEYTLDLDLATVGSDATASVNFALVCEEEVCGRVWCDDDGNRQFDALDDRPLQGMTIEVRPNGQPLAAPIATAPTNVDGAWCLDLEPGTYLISVVYPNAPLTDNIEPIGSTSRTVTVVAGQQTPSVDFLFDCLSSLGGRVFCEGPLTPCDDIWTPGVDVPVQGVLVELLLGGNVIDTTLTNAAGLYAFAGLEPGTYTTRVANTPANAALLAGKAGPTPATRSGTLPVGGNLASDITGLDFAYCQRALSGRVFCEGPDSDCDGIYQAGVDQPVSGVLVELVAGGLVVDTETTNAQGQYAFTGLDPAVAYTVRVADNATNAAILAGKAGPTPSRHDVTLGKSGTATDLDFAYCERALSGRVFCEGPQSDCDGVYDAGVDVPIQGVQIELVLGGAVVATTTTNAQGLYSFDGLNPSLTYVVRPTDNAANAALLVGKTGPTPPAYQVQIGTAGQPSSLDFAYCERMLAGRVFCEGPDADCDGRYDDGIDTPLSGVIVELVRAGVVVDTTTTSATGRYGFEGLAPGGAYTVRVANNPVNAALLEGKAGPSPLRYDVVVPAAGVLDNLDFGYCWRRIGGRVFCEGERGDCDGIWTPGVDRPLPGILVELVEAGVVIDTDTTDAEGRYAFVPVKPGVAYVTRVAVNAANAALLVDKTGPTPPLWNVTPLPTGVRDNLDFAYCTNKELSGRVYCEGPTDDCDGVYDAGVDTPIPGVLVELLVGGAVVDTTTTNAQGLYEFTGLLQGTAYTVRVAGNAVSPGNAVLLEDKTGPTPPLYTVTPGTSDLLTGLDFGYCLREISGRVFCEPSGEDCDGIYDVGVDLPIPGILVELVRGGAVVDTTLTDAQGRYMFTGLELGATYTTRVAANAANALLVANKTGPTPPLYTVVIPASGQEAAALNMLDFAYCEKAELEGTVYCEGPADDCNGVYDLGVDTPIPGVLMELVAAGAVVDTTTTNAAGLYRFTGLVVGTAYTVRPADNPANAALLKGKNGPTPPLRTVTPGTADRLTGLDFGYCLREISGRVFCEPGEPDCDGIYQPGIDTPISGFLVELVRNGAVVDSMLTNGDGRYVFSGLVLGGVYTTRPAVTPANALLIEGKTGPLPTFYTVVISVSAADAANQQALDFAYCKQNVMLSGTVYCEGPRSDCDGIYDVGVDTPIPGVQIELLAGGVVIDTTLTDGNGRWSFEGLAGGIAYTVRPADTAANAALLEGKTGPTPPSRTVTPGSDDPLTGLDFGYCLREIGGRVFCEPGEPDCDGIYQAGIDTPIQGMLVELVRNGVVVDTMLTGADGRYLFTGLELGATYTTRIPDTAANQALVFEKKGPTPAFWTVVIPASGQEAAGLFDLDFAYCKELVCEQKLCICVYIEPRDQCDQEFTPGVDRYLPGAHVFVKRADDNEGYLADGYTDEKGEFCWEGLPPGHYIAYVGGNQQHLGLLECDVFECRVTLRCNEDKKCTVPTCERCPRLPACEGEIREVEVEVDLCPSVHEEEECLPFEVVLGSFRDGQRVVLDRLETLACKDGPIDAFGFDRVIRVLSMEWTDWGTVRLRLRLTAPADGSLGSDEMVLAVTLGDDTATATTAWRAETIRPGAWFTFARGCTPLPPCDTMEGDLYQWLPLEPCGARFLVHDVLTYEAWTKCDEPRKPECEPVCLSLTVNGPCEWFHEGDARRAVLMVCPEGSHTMIDEVGVVFDGSTWTGERSGGAGHVTILSVEKTGEDDCHCWWTITLRLDHPCCHAGDPRCVPVEVKGELDGIGTDVAYQDVCVLP